MKFFLSFLVSSLGAHSIVFVHIGDELPNHVPIAMEQALVFNPNCPIYLIANEDAFKRAPFQFGENIHCVLLESLTKSKAHLQFINQSRLDRHSMKGFWAYAVERFFYLEELIRERRLTDVFHLENDVMLYANLEPMLPIFKAKYRGMIGATFDSDSRCIAGFVYISDLGPISELVKFMAKEEQSSRFDMMSLSSFKDQYDKIYIEYLPIIFPEYDQKIGLKKPRKEAPLRPERYSQYYKEFHAIFDAAAIGQYLGGASPRTGSARIGFVNETCVFNVSHLKISWKLDDQERWVPYASLEDVECPIVNLHIHSKNLSHFHSKRAL